MKTLSFALLITTFLTSAFGQQEDSRVTKSVIQKLARYTDSISVKNGGVGVLVHVFNPGVMDWNYVSGLADVDRQIPATPEMCYRIASISKLFCATAILKLVSTGALTLDDPISIWFTDEYVAKFINGDKITIRNLLNHTSGIYEPQGMYIDPINDSTDYSAILLDLIANMKHTAGYSNFFYSNANYNLLAEIVKKASKMPYKDYITSAIINPYKLVSTFVSSLPVNNRFKGYIPSIFLKKYSSSDKTSLIDASDFNLTYAIGAADISSSTRDLVKFYYALHSGKIIPLNLVAEMTSNTMASSYPSKRYGLGTMLFENNGTIAAHGHMGQSAGYKNLLVKSNLSNTYIAISINRFHVSDKVILEFMFGLSDIIDNHAIDK